MRVRFITNAAVSQSITFQNLLDTFLVAASATAGYQVFQTVKIREVEVWAVPVVGNPAAVSVEFSGVSAGIIGDQLIHSDTSMGLQPAHVRARPSRRSLASEYQLSTSANAFLLTCPAGSVVDVALTFRGTWIVASAVQNALVAATTGAFYLRGLDGLAVASTKLLPELPYSI